MLSHYSNFCVDPPKKMDIFTYVCTQMHFIIMYFQRFLIDKHSFKKKPSKKQKKNEIYAQTTSKPHHLFLIIKKFL